MVMHLHTLIKLLMYDMVLVIQGGSIVLHKTMQNNDE